MRRNFLSRIKGDIDFFTAYYKEVGSKERVALAVDKQFTEKELLNVLLFNIGALMLNLELIFVLAYLFYTMSGTIYMVLNCVLALLLLIGSVYTVCNLIISFSLYTLRVREKNYQVK